MVLNHQRTKLEILQSAKKIGQKSGLHYIYLGNVPVDGNTYCPNCGELVINRTGYTVIDNRLQNGLCPQCDRKIEGVL